MVRRRNKGQVGAGGAATLVALLAGFILLYLLFLPPDVREEILSGENLTDMYGNEIPDENEDKKYDKLILDESPKRLDFFSQKEVTHNIPEIRLFTTSEGSVLFDENSMYLKKSWFADTNRKFTFDLDDLDMLENVLLSFQAPDHNGRLIIVLNEQEIYNAELRSETVDPIKLSTNLLVEGMNTLSFAAGDPGFEFWKVNEIQLSGIRITGDMTDVSAQDARTTFRLKREESDNLERARLSFFVDCFSADEGVLTVKVNQRTVFSAVPDCGSTSPPIDITDHVLTGENSLDFSIDQGSLVLYHNVVKTQLEDPVNPVYYFELSKTEYEDAIGPEAELAINFTFAEYGKWKNARLAVNGHNTHISTKEADFGRTLDPFLFEGTNAIEIIPETTLDIPRMILQLDYYEDD